MAMCGSLPSGQQRRWQRFRALTLVPAWPDSAIPGATSHRTGRQRTCPARSSRLQDLERLGQMAIAQAGALRRGGEPPAQQFLQAGEVTDLALVRAQRGDL